MRQVTPVVRALAGLWNRLTEPSTAFGQRADRHLARLLASLLLFCIVLAVAGLARALMMPPPLQAPYFWATLIPGALFAAIYGLARTPRYRQAAMAMVVVMSLDTFALAILIREIDQLNLLTYLVIPTAFSGLFLSRRAAIMFSIANLVGIAAAAFAVAIASARDVLLGPFFYVLAVSGAMLIVVYYVNRYEAERRAEVEDSVRRYQRQAQEAALHERARAALSRELELPRLFRSLVEAVAETYGYTLVGLYLLEGEMLTLQHQVGYQQVIKQIPVSRGVMGRVARSGQPALVEDVRSDPDYVQAVERIASEVCVPLFDDGRCVGVLNVESARRLTQDDLRLMAGLSEHLSVAVGRARLYTSLRESESKLRAIVDNALDVIYIKDRDGRYLLINPEGARGVGRTPEEVLGQTDQLLFGEDHGAWIRSEDRPVIETGQPRVYEGPRVLVDGMERIFHRTKFPYKSDKGEIIGVIGISRDITERKQVERELERVNTHLSLLLDSLPIITYTAEAEGDYSVTYIAPNVTAATGFMPEDFTSRPTFWLERVHPEDRGKVMGDLPAENATGPFQDEYRWQVADGSYRWFLDIWRLVDLPDGKRQIVGVCHDITERKEAEESLREKQHFIERIAEASPQITYVYDLAEQRNVYISREIANVLGYSPEEIQAMGSMLFLRILHPEEQAKLPERLARFATARDDEILESEIRFVDAKGETHWLYFREMVFTRHPDGSARQVLGVATDITERKHVEDALKESEARYRLLAEMAPVSIAVIGFDSMVSYINPAGARLLGGESPDDIMGRSGYDFLPPESLKRLATRVEGPRQGWPTTPVETTIYRLDRQTVVVESRSMPVLYGGQTAVLSIMQDVTQRKEAERQQRELAAERERIKTLRRLIGDISHDLKTPLASMRLRYDLMKRVTNAETHQRNLEIFGSQLSFLEQQVQNLVTLWRLDSTEQDVFTFAPLDINGLARLVAAEYEPLAVSRGHTLTFDAGENLPLVRGDFDQLRRVIMHLLVNALNYTPEGGHVALRTLLDGCVVVEVCDNGIGIGTEDIGRIFDPFYRADRARRIDNGGMGLGLAIARRIVEAHGGDIIVESTPGEGSVFQIRLPVDDKGERDP